MKIPMKYTQKIHLSFLLRATSSCAAVLMNPLQATAGVFSGGDADIGAAESINVGGNSDLRATAIGIIEAVLSLMGVIAVLVIVIAGIMLVVGGGSDESRQKTLKIILYTIIGLVVILLASALVAFFIDVGSGGA